MYLTPWKCVFSSCEHRRHQFHLFCENLFDYKFCVEVAWQSEIYAGSHTTSRRTGRLAEHGAHLYCQDPLYPFPCPASCPLPGHDTPPPHQPTNQHTVLPLLGLLQFHFTSILSFQGYLAIWLKHNMKRDDCVIVQWWQDSLHWFINQCAHGASSTHTCSLHFFKWHK